MKRRKVYRPKEMAMHRLLPVTVRQKIMKSSITHQNIHTQIKIVMSVIVLCCALAVCQHFTGACSLHHPG